MTLFPLGIWPYAIGGLFVGLGVVLLYALRGRPIGASTSFAAVWSFFSDLPFFKDQRLLEMRSSRLLFSLGFILGAFIFALASGDWFATSLSPWRLLIGGLLVGFGVRMGRGCTSGHGICGLGSRSGPALLAVIIFTLFAIITANVLEVLL